MYALLIIFLIIIIAGFIRAWIFYAYVPVIKDRNEGLYLKIKGDLTGSFEYAPGAIIKHGRAYPRFYQLIVKESAYAEMPKNAKLAYQYAHLLANFGGVLFVIGFIVVVASPLYHSPLFE